MTGTEFSAEYKLGQRIASGGVESFLAHGTPTRRLVMVHQLAGAGDAERRRINSLLDALPSRGTTVLARVDVDGEPVVVTEFLPDFVTLRDWLEAAVAVQTTVVIRTGLPTPPDATAVAPRVDSPPASAPDAGRGDFTRLFGQVVPPPAGSLGGPLGQPLGGPPEGPPPRPPATPPIPAPPAAIPPQAPTAPPARAATPSAPPPASFTALFGEVKSPSAPAFGPPAAPPGPPPNLRPAPPPAPGFSSEPRRDVPPPAAAPPPPARGGSFTELFGAATPAGAPPPPASPPVGPPRPPSAAPPALNIPGHPPAQPAAPPSPDADVAQDTPKIRVMWRARGENTPTPPVSATGAMHPTPQSPAMGPPAPLARPSVPPPAPPVAPRTPAHAPPRDPFGSPALPGGTGAFGPPPFAPPPLAPPPSAGRGPDAGSVGPPELRLYASEQGARPDAYGAPYAPPPVSSPVPPPRPAGPSDFTRMLTPIEPAAPAPPPPPPPNAKVDPAAGVRKPSLVPLIIVLVVAIVGAAALILFFALRK